MGDSRRITASATSYGREYKEDPVLVVLYPALNLCVKQTDWHSGSAYGIVKGEPRAGPFLFGPSYLSFST